MINTELILMPSIQYECQLCVLIVLNIVIFGSNKLRGDLSVVLKRKCKLLNKFKVNLAVSTLFFTHKEDISFLSFHHGT
jgi:hypothetical protein